MKTPGKLSCLFLLLALCLLTRCGQEKPSQDKNNIPSADSTKQEKPVGIKVSYQIIEVENGYGYDITVNGKTYIHQPMIPALSGRRPFPTKEAATRVAELVAYKIRNNIIPPAVTIRELDSLGVR